MALPGTKKCPTSATASIQPPVAPGSVPTAPHVHTGCAAPHVHTGCACSPCAQQVAHPLTWVPDGSGAGPAAWAPFLVPEVQAYLEVLEVPVMLVLGKGRGLTLCPDAKVALERVARPPSQPWT
jgi:hypothetical protein